MGYIYAFELELFQARLFFVRFLKVLISIQLSYCVKY